METYEALTGELEFEEVAPAAPFNRGYEVCLNPTNGRYRAIRTPRLNSFGQDAEDEDEYDEYDE